MRIYAKWDQLRKYARVQPEIVDSANDQRTFWLEHMLDPFRRKCELLTIADALSLPKWV